jgi:undecaprenyl diphosphate synthase
MKLSTATTSGQSPGLESDWFSRYGIRHIAIIPDGNRRWAKQRSLPIEIGHANGLLKVLPDLVHKLCDAGVHTLTVWGFSTENWTREAVEIQHLMRLCVEFLRERIMVIAQRHDARVCHLGRKDRLFPEVLEALEAVEKATANNRSHVYNVALDYGGEDELLRASERLVAALRGGATGSDLRVTDFLDTAGQEHSQPDVVIRTSGEHRMSGFMPLQTVYSELFFVDEMFPDLNFARVQKVAEEFQWRKRRFGS